MEILFTVCNRGWKAICIPNTVIDDGTPLLWLRKDWIEKLGLKEPETVGEALKWSGHL